MQTGNQVSLIRKALYGVMSFGIVLSAFSAGNLSNVRAQEGEPATPTPEVQVQEPVSPPQNNPQERRSQTPVKAESDLQAQALTLGAPGLSFRYVQTFGVAEEAYPADTRYLNGPNGLFIDGSDNLFVAEELGSRLLKYQLSNKSNLLSIGKAGLQNRDTYSFNYPKDIAIDGSGNIWAVDNNRAVEYNPTGTFIQEFPAADPWNSGSDNSHFDEPRSIAFDSAGLMYIADRYNHRIQVYNVSGATPIYSTTIGVTGISGTDNAHFNEPVQIAFDSTGYLYVVDKNNYRVQRCVYSSSWSCSLFFGVTGVPGTDTSHLSQWWVNGIVIKGSDLFIADTANNRVLKCNLSGICSLFAGASNTSSGTDNSHLFYPDDVAVDSAGNVYVSDSSNSRIQKFTSSGGAAIDTLGTTQVPYVPDASRYNTPFGMAVGSDGSLIMTEYAGYRLAKLNAAGVPQWTVGQAGVWMWNADNTHFGDLYNGPMAVAVNNSGLIYVADTGSHRVQKCTAAGICSTFVGVSGNAGSDNTHFNRPAGVAVDASGNVYVGDRSNHRIQKCTAAGVCTTFAGFTGVSGADNTHFNGPMGLTVDSSGNVYVADAWNYRVQKCTAGGSCSTFAGVANVWGDDFGHFSQPRDIAVDTQGRVYVADIWNNRVQVFDAAGAYLTTIGGSWGSRSGEIRNPAGVDVDSQGNVYITDSINGRIQKFAPGVPGWRQKNINGFGDRNNNVANRMSVFNGYLYAGTGNDVTGGEVWRSADGINWNQVNLDGFGDAANTQIQVSESFNGNLYVGTLNNATGAEIWRCTACDGTDWAQVASGGFGNSNNSEIERVIVFSNTLYATTNNSNTGVEVWISNTGNSSSWTQVVAGGFGDTKNTGLWAAALFNGYLYMATGQWDAFNEDPPTNTGTEVWRTNNGTTWSQVNTDGFGDKGNISPWLISFNGYLYMLSWNIGTGSQIWRCATCDGTDWTQVVSNGFGDGNNIGGNTLLSFGGRLYADTWNDSTGTEIWQTADGTSWSQVNIDGFGNSNNLGVRGAVVFNGGLYFGTLNGSNGAGIWQKLNQIYLPLIKR
jgi:streptogramin lyase